MAEDEKETVCGRKDEIQVAGSDIELLSKLEAWLASYDHVFLIPSKNGTVGTAVRDLLRAGADKAKGRRLLVLSAVMLDVGGGFNVIRIDRKEEEQLLQLYHMYEFSDHFSVIAETETYGGLFHLVETGALSMEEAAEALFAY